MHYSTLRLLWNKYGGRLWGSGRHHTEMQGDPSTTAAPASNQPRSITPQPTSTSLRSLTSDATAVRYHVVSTPRDSDCESGIGPSSLQLNISGTSRSTGDAATAQRRRLTASEEERRRRSKYRKRRNRIGLMLVFALILLFAGLVICANKKEYVAGVTISVMGVLLGSSSMVLCLLTTDSCERVHGFRERVSSYSRSSRRRNNDNASADSRQTAPRRVDGASATVSAANSSINVHDNLLIHPLPPTAVCNISGDFLDHLPPPTYETAEILRREDMAIEQSLVGDVPGAVGGAGEYQWVKLSIPWSEQEENE